jgi:hypothetical protein
VQLTRLIKIYLRESYENKPSTQLKQLSGAFLNHIDVNDEVLPLLSNLALKCVNRIFQEN